MTGTAQIVTFEKLYYFNNSPTDGAATCFRQTPDGGYIIGGSQFIFPDAPCLVRTDANGDTVWVKHYNFGQANIRDVVVTTDSGFAIVGFDETNAMNFFVARLNGLGDTIWTRKFDIPGGYSGGHAIRQTSDGGFIVAGAADNPVAYDGLLIRMDASGDTLWTKKYGGTGTIRFNCVEETQDGGFIICGTNELGSSANKLLLIKTNSAGDTLWTRKYGATSTNQAMGNWVSPTTDGGYIVTGGVKDGVNWFDVLLMKTDSAGNVAWAKKYWGPPNYDDIGRSVQQTSDGGFAVGAFMPAPCGYSPVLIKTDANGDTTWINSYCDNLGLNDEAWYAQPTTDGGYAFCGRSRFNGVGSSGMWLVKADANGSTQCNTLPYVIPYDSVQMSLFSATTVVSGGMPVSHPSLAISGGCTVLTMCTTLEIPEEQDHTAIIYPNPVTDDGTITIRTENTTGAVSVSIMDVTGRILCTRETVAVNGEIHLVLDPAGFSAGLYTCTISQANGECIAAQFVIQ